MRHAWLFAALSAALLALGFALVAARRGGRGGLVGYLVASILAVGASAWPWPPTGPGWVVIGLSLPLAGATVYLLFARRAPALQAAGTRLKCPGS